MRDVIYELRMPYCTPSGYATAMPDNETPFEVFKT